MHLRLSLCLSLVTLCTLVVGVLPARCGDAENKPPPEADPAPQRVRKAIERSLVFLEKDAAKWRKERECSTCHHGTITVWALSEAKSQGYAVSAETLADTAKWTKDRLLETA